jgi:hypothetical protein
MWRDSIAWVGVVQSAIAAGSGLLGVGIGGIIAAKNQKRERRNTRIRQQLEGFYSPLLGMREEIKAKSHLREHLHSIASETWQDELLGHGTETKIQIIEQRSGAFQKLAEYSEDQRRQELIPLYAKMLEHFSANMWLCEPSTMVHYAALSDFVEIWNRFLAKAIPVEMHRKIEHWEQALVPFYDDLKMQFDKLTVELSK